MSREFEDSKVLSELKTIISYIKKKELTPEEIEAATQETVFNFDNYFNPGWLKYRKSVSTNAAALEWSDEGSTVSDLKGNVFIDCIGGFGVHTCGHSNQEVIEVVKAQMDKQCMSSQELLDLNRGYLARIMAQITPGDLKNSFFTNGGAEAVEMALKLARISNGGRWFISTIGGFHGKSMGAVSVVGKESYRAPYGPMVEDVKYVQYGNIQSMRDCITELIQAKEEITAVILELIQGEAGVITPPKGYLKAVRELCDEFDIILIIDEIQTGMGRTGTFWRCDAEEIVPDILVYGKAFGGGILPITGIICRPHVWIQQLVDNPWLLGSPTFGGNPLCCSAALATIKFMLEHDIAGQCRDKGKYFKEKLDVLRQTYPEVIYDVRGQGLMLAVEFKDDDIGYKIAKGLFAVNVLTAGTLNNAKCIRLQPSATITYEQIDTVIKRLGQVIDQQ